MPRLPLAACLLTLTALAAIMLPQTLSRETAARMPHLQDLTGRLVIGCAFDGTVSAPAVCEHGRQVGVYLDDSTPHLSHWVAVARQRYPHGLILIARPMGHPGCPWRGVTCADEWYPWCSGAPAWAWGRMPSAQALILQDRYPGLGGCHRPPPYTLAARLIRQARAERPKPRLILIY